MCVRVCQSSHWAPVNIPCQVPCEAAAHPHLQVVVQQAADTAELPKTFTFDNVFDGTSTQGQVYEETARPIVDSVLEGYNGTVFAYGQTGTGKTHTMDGGAGDTGIIPRTFQQIFEAIQVTACLMYLTVRRCMHAHINVTYILGATAELPHFEGLIGLAGRCSALHLQKHVRSLSTPA